MPGRDSGIMNHGRVERLLSKRLDYLTKRCANLGITPPDKSMIPELARKASDQGMKCHYCGCELNIYPTPQDYKNALSLDHKVPLSVRPDNSAGNIVISCARCNFAKASLSYGLFTRLISCLKSTDPQLLEDFLEECFEARSRRPFMEQGVRQQAAKDDMFMAGGIDWF